MNGPISNKVVTGLLIVAVLVAFSPFFTGNTIDSANNQEATAVASARQQCLDSVENEYFECVVSGKDSDQCYESICALAELNERSAEELCSGFWCWMAGWWPF